MRRCRIFLLGTALSLATALGAAETKPAGHILLTWDFEDEHPFHHLAIEGEPPTVVIDPVDPHNHVMRAVLPPHAKRPERSEVRWDRISVGDERWVGFRIFRPNLPQNGYTCYFQLGPISGSQTPKAIGLFQITGSGTPLQTTWRVIGFLERVGAKTVRKPVGETVAGHWEQWVQHLRLRNDAEGLLEVWRNDEQVASLKGKNSTWQDNTIPIKWGVYVGTGNVAKAEITSLYDDIIVGDENCRYQDVVRPGR